VKIFQHFKNTFPCILKLKNTPFQKNYSALLIHLERELNLFSRYGLKVIHYKFW
jgi:hypothetical protein